MPRKLLPIEEILTRLEAGPRRIAELTAGFGEAQLHAPPRPGEWSTNEVLAHLRSCNDVWGGHILAMIAEDRPARKAINPRTYIKQTNYLDLDFAPSLQALTTSRAELIAVLTPLAPEGWERTGMASGWGQVYRRSVIGEGDALARHEWQHLKQIEVIVHALRV